MTSASGEFVVSDSGRIGLERVVVQCRLEKAVQWIIAKGIQTQSLEVWKIVARSASPSSVHVVWNTFANSPSGQGPDQSKDPIREILNRGR
jgi:hypothetical protein